MEPVICLETHCSHCRAQRLAAPPVWAGGLSYNIAFYKPTCGEFFQML